MNGATIALLVKKFVIGSREHLTLSSSKVSDKPQCARGDFAHRHIKHNLENRNKAL